MGYRPSDPDTCLVCDDINTIIQQLLDEQPDPEPPADVTAPFSTSTLLPEPNIAGWHADDVVVLLEVTDNEGGSGVKEIEYTLSGAQSGSGVIAGNITEITITAEGYTTITYFSRDEAGNAEAPHSIEVRIDRTPPAIAVQNPIGGLYVLNEDVPATYAVAGKAAVLKFSLADAGRRNKAGRAAGFCS